MQNAVNIIGAGFAGCESAWAVASRGIPVRLFEMKPLKFSPAHKDRNFCEPVCSNSFKASRVNSAAGLLKAEMRMLGSLTLECAEITSVGAGGALAVDRVKFAEAVTAKVKSHPLIEIITGEVTEIPDGITIIATGPLTTDTFAEKIAEKTGGLLSFYDAAAPIVSAESIDLNTAFFGARYGKGDDDYLNCPFSKEEYDIFYNALINAETALLHDIDKPLKVYEGCMPIEVLAKRGYDSPRFGPMKPVGFTDKNGKRPYALVQLRKENNEGRFYNIVGFQTNLKFAEQKRVFSLIPGLLNADFIRYGVMHRNSFVNSPLLLNKNNSLKTAPNIFLAGQITGFEGYMESAASGIIAGINAAAKFSEKPPLILPETTMIGALTKYITDESVKDFQPMGANMGILPPLDERIKDKALKYSKLAEISLEELEKEINNY
ncbi:MAG: methylenetetrahydrofolate--tRNA-(uracil(54)-C(5))-methyltransferase (FADH(2)-oxidizing) TrmFO [Ruminococcus sp.]|jgi:methylenetetrahydrofolate--tRNA-(uracil-5-)-methyltransferase|nr:methylenetetrahydrofolate--tRNA-(uracil(54)-C(5))-methyltransferase (FADH(2)-oxidizing) TrmFO [Ruminococcus sp.]